MIILVVVVSTIVPIRYYLILVLTYSSYCASSFHEGLCCIYAITGYARFIFMIVITVCTVYCYHSFMGVIAIVAEVYLTINYGYYMRMRMHSACIPGRLAA